MIYLDNAATTFPKPEQVKKEVMRCIGDYCGNPGRGSHRLAMAAAEKIYSCREEIAGLFNMTKPENIVFTENTTHSLNLCIKGLLRRGDHIIISDMEHNSVYRPVYRLAKDKLITFDVFRTHPVNGIINSVKNLIRRNTKLVICTHVPNISSSVFPIDQLGELCKRHGIIFVVDAAQSAGHCVIDLENMNIDALCIPGHKGLYGIQGCGAVCFSERSPIPDTLTEGGNGVNSLDGLMPDFLPERFEVGTLPTPAIAGLCEGIKEIKKYGISQIKHHDDELWQYAYEGLARFNNIEVYDPHFRGSVLLFNVNGIPSENVASELGKNNICVRGGYHCNALGHRTLRTKPGGAVRISFGMFNNSSDIDELLYCLRYIQNK